MSLKILPSKRPKIKGKYRVSPKGNSVYMVSLGCPRNLVDSEVMLGLLLQSGYEVAQEVEEADFLIVNTCGFLEASRQESVETVQDLADRKKGGARLIVAGCMVQSHSQEIKERTKGVDYYLGSGDVESILQAVEEKECGEVISTAKSYLEVGEVPRQQSTPKHFAYLKIAEGCLKRCAYCIIPSIKGNLKSKPIDRVYREFHTLLDRGVQEVILIAQDLGDFGKERLGRGRSELYTLLERLLDTSKDFWLRLLYLYPDEITEDLVQLMKGDPRLLPYLDMPIQHVNNTLLKSMRRKTSKEQIISTIERLRGEIPHVVIRTSLIVGFPGETEEQFEELKDFLYEHPLDNVGIFKYSREKGSTAYDYKDQVPEEVKERRYHELMQCQQEIVEQLNESWIGAQVPVMVEGYHPDSELLMRGRHYGQCPEIDPIVIINDGRKVKEFGQIYTVEITDVAGYDLIGSVL